MNIREHYNKIIRTKEERAVSRVANIRFCNNYIKACLIKTYVKPGMSVLDLGCGKGGDLIKYEKCKIKEYYGLDIAELSVYEAKLRHNTMCNTFRGYFDLCDVYNTYFDLRKRFDVISSQFSLHYAFCNDKSISITCANINKHLGNGGIFMFTAPNKKEILRRHKIGACKNKYYRIDYDGTGNMYHFTLHGCINNCIEYFVDMDILNQKLAAYNIRLVRQVSLDLYFDENIQYNQKMASRMKCRQPDPDELEVMTLYDVVVYKKD